MGRKESQRVYSLGNNCVEMPYSHPCSWLQDLFSRVLRWGALVLHTYITLFTLGF